MPKKLNAREWGSAAVGALQLCYREAVFTGTLI
jgi:hypothetical protein